jgi:hypothetical protein
MRRLLGLAVLFVVLYMCVPSYGYFLIYNISTTVKGADDATGKTVTIPMKGTLVMNIDDSCDTLVDANLILYGKNASGQKVYVQLNYSDSDKFLRGGIWYVGNSMFIDFRGEPPFGFEILLQGKSSLKDIGKGTGNKKSVPSSMNGVAMLWDSFVLGPDANQAVSGTANASATLWVEITKFANANEWTQDTLLGTGTIAHEGLLQILVADKGFSAATVPTPD